MRLAVRGHTTFLATSSGSGTHYFLSSSGSGTHYFLRGYEERASSRRARAVEIIGESQAESLQHACALTLRARFFSRDARRPRQFDRLFVEQGYRNCGIVAAQRDWS
jgi:hypothetical protein